MENNNSNEEWVNDTRDQSRPCPRQDVGPTQVPRGEWVRSGDVQVGQRVDVHSGVDNDWDSEVVTVGSVRRVSHPGVEVVVWNEFRHVPVDRVVWVDHRDPSRR